MEILDAVILGSGPAGMQGAIYLARKNIKFIMFGKEESSALYKAKIENFFGYKDFCLGKDLLENTKNKLINLGVKKFDKYIKNITKEKEYFTLIDETENKYFSKSIIIATGIERKILNIENEKKYLGRGISYCIECDGFFFRNKTVCVSGNGLKAIEGAIYLSNIAKQVFLVFNNENSLKNFKKSENLYNIKNIDIIFEDKIVSARGDEILKEIILKSGKILKVDGLFIEMGNFSIKDMFFNLNLSMKGEHINVDSNQETNIKGIYATGDITGEPYQLSKALSDGMKAGINLANYVKNIN